VPRLDYAFQNGVIHRDIKPANILLSERDEIKISDFGTAKISHATHTQIDGFLGSPAYMSPEQINEEGPSVQTDIYSLGVVMYELLTGRLPFRAENAVAMINKILNEDPVPIEQLRPDLPEKLVEIVGKAMHKDPKVRYATWFEMASELANTFPQLERYSTRSPRRRSSTACGRSPSSASSATPSSGRCCAAPCGRRTRATRTCCSRARSAGVLHHRGRPGEGREGRQAPQRPQGRRLLRRDGLPLGRSRAALGVDRLGLRGAAAQDRRDPARVALEGCQLRFNREFLRTLIERLTWTSSVLAQFRR
jgi:serine/threonine protein kinase